VVPPWTITATPSASCRGETCACGAAAMHKIGEEIADDDPMPVRHNLTQYVCRDCFIRVLQPYADDQRPVDVRARNRANLLPALHAALDQVGLSLTDLQQSALAAALDDRGVVAAPQRALASCFYETLAQYADGGEVVLAQARTVATALTAARRYMADQRGQAPWVLAEAPATAGTLEPIALWMSDDPDGGTDVVTVRPRPLLS
jgi:hypothetical protein